MLELALISLPGDMRSRAQVASSPAESISLTRDKIALYSLAAYSMRRGSDLPFIMGSHILKLPASKGLTFILQLGETLRVVGEAMVVLADRDCPAICAFRALTGYTYLPHSGSGYA